jgi:hypothetical protein
MRRRMMRGWMGWNRSLLLMVAGSVFGMALQANATQISMSNATSDPGIEVTELRATLGFAVTGNILTLSVSNDSASRAIASLYFNAADHITDHTLKSKPRDWKLKVEGAKGNPTDADLFGVFDYAVAVGGRKAKDRMLEPGDVGTFVFEIAGAGSFSADDFSDEISSVEEGEVQAFVAAAFGTGKDSVLGATHAPEPSTAILMGMGLGLLSATRGRKCAQSTQPRTSRMTDQRALLCSGGRPRIQ